MVVQQNKPFKIWGKASSHQQVKIETSWLESPVVVHADGQGDFLGIVAVPEVKPGNFTQHWIRVSSNGNMRELRNVLIGEVWFCGGQSNMQSPVKEVVNGDSEVSAANFEHIRLFKATLNFSNEPLDTIGGEWQTCTPETVGGFSAVGYFFGRQLYQALNVPVGVIFSGIGASSAQAYVPRSVLAADTLLNAAYLQPYLSSDKSKEAITSGFTFEKVTRPFLLYNALINPFKKLSIRGFCWYQGESNRQERESYTHLTQSLISSWRSEFGQGELPFYYVQVAPFFWDVEDPALADYAFFREAQQRVSTLNGTDMVLTVDVGEAKDLHPKNKKPVGIRLALTALNRTYGKLEVAYRGPEMKDVIFNNGMAMVTFVPATVQSGLRTNDNNPPRFFTLAGADGIFHPANATIEGSQVKVKSSKVKHPVALRYAFTNYAVTNLENGAGLPVVPFRTDDFPEKK